MSTEIFLSEIDLAIRRKGMLEYLIWAGIFEEIKNIFEFCRVIGVSEMSNPKTLQFGAATVPFELAKHHPDGYDPKPGIGEKIIQMINQEKNVDVRMSLIRFYGGLTKFLRDGGAETVFEAQNANDDKSAKIVKVNMGQEDKYFILFTNGTIYARAVVDWSPEERKRNGYTESGQELLCEEFCSLEDFKRISGISNPTVNDLVGWTYGESGELYSKLEIRT